MSLTDDILIHYGMPRRSGRYPWGSGDNPYQHSGDFLSRDVYKRQDFISGISVGCKYHQNWTETYRSGEAIL